jgi:hypothetical protein
LLENCIFGQRTAKSEKKNEELTKKTKNMEIGADDKWGICLQTLVAVRKEASHQSEQVTQILYGECFMILAVREGWVQIQMRYDGYRGWILAAQISLLDEGDYERFGRTQQYCTELISYVEWPTGRQQPILLGSPLVELPEMVYHGESYFFRPISDFARVDNLVELAELFIGAPYLWGGRSPFGVDCSGLVQLLYKMVQVRLSRDAYQQAEEGKLVAFDEMQIGDLAFFKGKSSKIEHVGIVWHEQQILHATAQGVCIQALHRKGIFDGEQYTHNFAWLRRHL